MADNLPLIPNKQSVCADVRPVLRAVFRELDSLPPLVVSSETRNDEDKCSTISQPNNWVDEYSTEQQEIWRREEELKQEYAKRLSCLPLQNIYKLHSPVRVKSPVAFWKKELGVLQRKDLIPTLVQDAGRDDKLWVRNILNSSSCDASSVSVERTLTDSPVPLTSPDENTMQSISIGDVTPRQRQPLPRPSTPGAVAPQPEHVVCAPPKLDFINFTVGRLYTQTVRLVNVSKWEVRLSVRPPRCADLLLQMMSSRGLRLTAGASVTIQVQFRPREVRTLHDRLRVRISVGGDLCVPIACYMEPPLLHILVSNVPSSVSCTLDDSETYQVMSRYCDLLDLGAKLLGEEHCMTLVFHCESEHASFFLLAEEDWLSFCINSVTARGGVVSGALSVTPAWWGSGAALRAQCVCHALGPGLQHAQFRLLCSTGVTRPLHLLADAVLHRPEDLTLLAHEKDYDIRSEDDPACEYFVHLGTAFPGRALASIVHLLNRSPVNYTYFWKERPWGVCCCAENGNEMDESCGSGERSDRFCIGALETREMKEDKCMKVVDEPLRVHAEPAAGEIAPRSSRALRIHAPDVGTILGVHRTVLMFVLKNIPKESLPSDYDPMIVISRTVEESNPLFGNQVHAREVCDVVCFQLEVWWEVVPARFVLNPPVLPLFHSRRVHQLDMLVHGVQLFGRESIRGLWSVPERILSAPPPEPADLRITHSVPFRLQLQLPVSHQHDVQQDSIALISSNDDWKSRCTVSRRCAARSAVLRPAIACLGTVLPGAYLNATIDIVNDTYHELEWKAVCMRWSEVRPPCGTCDPSSQHGVCSCELLRPAEGLLNHGERDTLHYSTNAPQWEGPAVTLVRSSQSGATCCALVAARTLGPRLLLRVLSCGGDDNSHCSGCLVDEGDSNSPRGSSVLRPRVALTLAHSTRYKLRVSNLTPIPTTLGWDPPPGYTLHTLSAARYSDISFLAEDDDMLKVVFIPSDIEVAGHARADITVVLEGRRVCARRVFLRRARATGSSKPLYLLIDTAIAGLEIVCEVPLGAGMETDCFVAMRRTERGECLRDVSHQAPSTPEEIFSEYDRSRRLQKEKKCHCPYKMLYIPPQKMPQTPHKNTGDFSPVEIVCEPVQLTRVCGCSAAAKPALPELSDPCCLQFIKLPLRTVRSRALVIRNESAESARWTATTRRWSRRRRRTLCADKWAGDVGPAGLLVECAPSGGVLNPRDRLHLDVSVYADCWGLYSDQLLIQIEKLEPIVLDLWAEAESPPLQFALKPNDTYDETVPVLWVSASDPEHTLQARNVSRSELTVYTYVLTEHVSERDALPFRLYLRLFDVAPRACPCVAADNPQCNSEDMSEPHSAHAGRAETGVELFLAPDHGSQSTDHYKVHPQVLSVPAGGRAEWKVALQPIQRRGVAPHTKLLFRISPVDRSGEGWYRPDPQSEWVLLRQTVRVGTLDVSCGEVRVKLCALDMPNADVVRVRKRFQVRNIGNGPLELDARTSAPWRVVKGLQHQDHCMTGCVCDMAISNRETLDPAPLYLEPKSSVQVCVEVSLNAGDISVEETQRRLSVQSTPLLFCDAGDVLLNLPLVVELEFPLLRVAPPAIHFGYVTDGSTRKTYFTVSHSSPSKTLQLATQCHGATEFSVWPPALLLPPRGSAAVYVQYTARWHGGGTAECRVHVSCVGVAERWGRSRGGTAVRCSATPTRDGKFSGAVRDHTDDKQLLPADLTH